MAGSEKRNNNRPIPSVPSLSAASGILDVSDKLNYSLDPGRDEKFLKSGILKLPEFPQNSPGFFKNAL
jgi:hypothetical protein